jgi:hypothetical protein
MNKTPQLRLSKKRWRQNLAAEQRRARLKLQSNGENDGQEISNEMVDAALIEEQLKRIQRALPDFKSRFKNSSGWNNFDRNSNISIDLVNKLPFQSLKKNVHWLTVKEQDKKSDISLTEELELFALYVAVSF